jgi:acyl-CoA thioesterase II
MTADALLELLELERLDRDLYRATAGPKDQRPHLFGGQVAAQALRAAALTAPEGRLPHSLHGYFLRRGDTQRDVILRVYRDRDGGSFSSRRVVAIQEGEVIFTVSASFHHAEPGGEYQLPFPEDVPDPVQVDKGHGGGPTTYFETRPIRLTPPSAEHLPSPEEHLVPKPLVHAPGGPRSPSRLWIRTLGSLPDDPIIHTCVLTYITDFGSGFANVGGGIPQGGPSLDHSIWFHQPIRMDEWVLLDLWPMRASNARGTYLGSVHDRHEILGCILAQEALLRDRQPPPGGADSGDDDWSVGQVTDADSVANPMDAAPDA